MNEVLAVFLQRGDLAHLALLLWALGASALLARTLRDLADAHQRFDTFLRELARFNTRYGEDNAPPHE
jgi:hypothetical protein